MDFGVLILESGFWILGIGFCRFDFGVLICVFGFWKFEMLFLFYIFVVSVLLPCHCMRLLGFGLLKFGFWVLDFCESWLFDFEL